MLSSGKLAPAFKVYLKMRENTRSNIRYYANRMTSLLSSELPFQTKFPCENSRAQNRSGCSSRSLYHAAWSSLTCLSSILRQTSRTSSAHSNSYRQKKPVTVPLSLSLVRNVPLQIGTFPFQTLYFNSRLKNSCAQSYARSCMMQF